VKTHWINMLSLLKWVMPKYKSFIVKMHLDSIKDKTTQDNVLLFGDLEFIFCLPIFANVEGDAHIDRVRTMLKCIHC
jgi:hypothetical protein